MAEMKPIALATCASLPSLCTDERLLLPELNHVNIPWSIPVWDDFTVDWSRFGLIVLRSCWDYHLKTRRFRNWLTHLEDLKVRVVNSISTISGNMDKHYLRALGRQGVLIPDSLWIKSDSQRSLEYLIEEAGWNEVIVKPTVSASAFETWRTRPGCALRQEDRFRALLRNGEVLIQRFIPEVITSGELSLVFIDGEYSHTVLKRPAAGDFRVQEEHGATRMAVRPPRQCIEIAASIVRCHAASALYARVDVVRQGDCFVLMELELVDPMLFFQYGPGAARRFASAIHSRVVR